MLFYEQPGDPWTPYDFKILEAYQILQDETCNQCGHPIWVCRSTSTDVDFHVRSVTCNATKALKRAEDLRKPSKEREKDPKVKKEWGVSYYTSPYATPTGSGSLPTRFDFYEEMAR